MLRLQKLKALHLIFWVFQIALTGLFVGIGSKVEAVDKSTCAINRTQPQFLQGTVAHNELIDNLERLGIKCLIHGDANSLIVEKVALGSSGYYANIMPGDAIKDLYKLSDTRFVLSLERGKKLYQANINLLPTQITNDLFKVSASAYPNSAISSTKLVDREPEKKLLPYQIELLIDISGSMRYSDGTGNLGKFEWCCDQMHNLSDCLELYKKTFNITIFNTAYTVYEDCTSADVERIYHIVTPKGATDIVDPLTDRLYHALEQYSKTGKPTLIVVITDGLPNVPNDPRAVNQALIDFTSHLTGPNQVLVTFVQIGDTFDGREFCMDLDSNLVKEGAKYDIVNTVPFYKLKQEGLVAALVDVVMEVTDTYSVRNIDKQERHFQHFIKNLPASSQMISHATSTAEEQKRQRQEIERQILGQ